MDNKKKAVIYMILSAFFFTIMQLFVKLSGDLPVFEKALFRNIVSLIVAFLVLIIIKQPLLPQKDNRKIIFLRSFFGLLGVICFFYSIDHLVMSDASILNKLSPFFVTIFAIIFLKERIKKYHYFILSMVFLGTLLILRPRFNFTLFPALMALLSAVFAGGAYTILRFLKNKENPITIVFIFSAFSLIGLTPFVFLDFVMPNIIQLVYLIMIGIFAALGQFCITISYKYAPAAQVSVYNYLSVVFALIAGFIVLGELPDFISFAGTTIIITMAILNYKYNFIKS